MRLIYLLVALATFPAGAQERAVLDELIRRFAHADIDAREEAARKIREHGTAALPALESAAGDADPEVRARSRALIFEIERNDIWSRARFAWRHPANGHVHLTDAHGNISERELPGSLFALLPDGAGILALGQESVWILKEGGKPRKLADTFLSEDLQVSQDGGRVLACGGCGTLIDTATGAARRVPNYFDVSGGVWVDSERVAYASGRSVSVWNCARDTTPVAHPADRLILSVIGASRDGRRILASTRMDREGSSQTFGLSLLDPEKKEWAILAEGKEEVPPVVASWRPDGRAFACVWDHALILFEGPDWNPKALLRGQAEEVVGWIDDRRLVLLRLHRVDDSARCERADAGVVRYSDLVMIDVQRSRTIPLTEGDPINYRAFMTLVKKD